MIQLERFNKLTMADVKKWWQSKTIQGAVIQVLVLLSLLFGLDLGDQEATVLIQAIFGGIGAIMSIYGRIVAKHSLK